MLFLVIDSIFLDINPKRKALTRSYGLARGTLETPSREDTECSLRATGGVSIVADI